GARARRSAARGERKRAMSAGAARPIGVGVIGLGFMGRTHVAAFRAAASTGRANRLVAVADSRIERLGGDAPKIGNLALGGDGERLFDPREVRAFASPDELLGDPSVELVSICTPTPTHVDLALRALEANKHVLLEKPVAISSREVARLAAGVAASKRLC